MDSRSCQITQEEQNLYGTTSIESIKKPHSTQCHNNKLKTNTSLTRYHRKINSFCQPVQPPVTQMIFSQKHQLRTQSGKTFPSRQTKKGGKEAACLRHNQNRYIQQKVHLDLKRISVSGLVSYKFDSLLAKKSLGFNLINHEEKMLKDIMNAR